MASEQTDESEHAGVQEVSAQLFGQFAAAESLRVVSRLNDAGFVAYLAGGCVRDALLGREPKDFDVATNATPDAVRQIFGKRNTLAFGASFGVIGVLPPKTHENAEPGEVTPTEVATFRSDGQYSDGRRPDSVRFGDPKEDALRRDFTINGMFYDPASQSVIDFVGGQTDLKACLLRTIGPPIDRFGEDKLRMLRAVRFATTLGLNIDEGTLRAIQHNATQISVVSGERIGAEMRKVLSSPHAATGLRLLQNCGLASEILPSLSQCDFPTIERALSSLEQRDLSTVLSCLLLRHPNRLDSLAELANQWKLSNEEVRRSKFSLAGVDTILQANELRWSQVQPLLVDRDAEVVIQVARAIAIAEDQSTAGVQLASEALAWAADELDPATLLTGDDLRRLGFNPGPLYKKILSRVRESQLDREISTTDEAIQLARQIAKQ